MIVSKCAICGGKVEEREVSEEMRIGNDFVIIENVRAGVCVECGERYYPPRIVDRLRDIERSIRDRKTLKKLTLIGSTYRLGYDTLSEAINDNLKVERGRRNENLNNGRCGLCRLACSGIRIF